VSFEKGLLLLGRISPHERAARIIEAHYKNLHGLLDAGDDGLGFTPIDLGILAGFEFERNECLL
jgi:hypothetical protein